MKNNNNNNYIKALLANQAIATDMFKGFNADILRIVKENKGKINWDGKVTQAEKDLIDWENQSNRKQNYTPEELANARLIREVANQYELENRLDMDMTNSAHQALINESIIQSGLSEKIIKEGKLGNKLGLVELSARLSPGLTFTGSSAALSFMCVPYGKESRGCIGEKPTQGSFITDKVAYNSAQNLKENFGVKYALAETSEAPRIDVPKSGKKPGIYISGFVGDSQIINKNLIIDTLIRSEFNSRVREEMFFALQDMYK